MQLISSEQIRQIKAIIDDFENFQCVETAQAIQEYLVSQNIEGKRLKIYTGTSMGWDANIYDDLLGYAISVNGRHEGVRLLLMGWSWFTITCIQMDCLEVNG